MPVALRVVTVALRRRSNTGPASRHKGVIRDYPPSAYGCALIVLRQRACWRCAVFCH